MTILWILLVPLVLAAAATPSESLYAQAMACRKGVDADHGRARQLLRHAAEQGYGDAVEQLELLRRRETGQPGGEPGRVAVGTEGGETEWKG